MFGIRRFAGFALPVRDGKRCAPCPRDTTLTARTLLRSRERTMLRDDGMVGMTRETWLPLPRMCHIIDSTSQP